ncbi:MAG TPA: DUF6325 family protein [Jiangellaceae bacterium]|jgi:uncharacterized membrane protein
MAEQTPDVGPVDIVMIGFDGNEFRGEIAPALLDLVQAGIVRLLDGVFVYKDADGSVGSLEIGDMGPDLHPVFVDVDGQLGLGLLDAEDVETVGKDLEPNTSALMLVFENTWAAKFVTAVRNANGTVLEFARIPAEAVAQAMASEG